MVDHGVIEAAKAAFRGYYIARGSERIIERLAYDAPKVGVFPSEVVVKELGHRWASCSPSGNLAFHWKCLDHTDAFWNEVDKVMPTYGERKEWLRLNGAGLDI